MEAFVFHKQQFTTYLDLALVSKALACAGTLGQQDQPLMHRKETGTVNL